MDCAKDNFNIQEDNLYQLKVLFVALKFGGGGSFEESAFFTLFATNQKMVSQILILKYIFLKKNCKLQGYSCASKYNFHKRIRARLIRGLEPGIE